jgi:hypothetical protein
MLPQLGQDRRRIAHVPIMFFSWERINRLRRVCYPPVACGA